MSAGIGHNGGPALEPIKLRWYQEEAVQALFDFFNDPARAHSQEPANPLVCLPTGTGKSVVIAEFFRRALIMYPGTRAIMATHVKELIRQNAAKMLEIWPLAPLGVYSAGLKQRDTMQPLIFGGVQSMVGKFPLLGKRDLLGIDEAHLLSPNADTSYVKLIEELTKGPAGIGPNSPNVNAWLKVIGFTATPYRLGLGPMTNGPLFTHVVYDLCNIDGFNRLLADGFLCPLIPRRTNVTLDVSGVGMSQGEFKAGELQAAVDVETVTYGALKQVVEEGQDRACWLIFASGVEHAEHVAEMMNSIFGIPTVCMHSKKTDAENDEAFAAWKSGKARAAVSMNKLTTGVDHKPVDLIAMLRPTMSPGLWVQMLGRGTRPYDYLTETNRELATNFPFTKNNCLVLDFAGNTRRLGPINDPVIPRPKGSGPPGDAPVRICEAIINGVQCNTYNHASARECIVCGTEFTFAEKLNRNASNLELLRSDLPQIEPYEVKHMVLIAHTSKASGRASIRVAYFCGLKTFYEYISVESPVNFFRKKSRDWFRQRFHYSDGRHSWEPGWDEDVPTTNAKVLELVGELRAPRRINVWVNKQTPEIMGYEF